MLLCGRFVSKVKSHFIKIKSFKKIRFRQLNILNEIFHRINIELGFWIFIEENSYQTILLLYEFFTVSTKQPNSWYLTFTLFIFFLLLVLGRLGYFERCFVRKSCVDDQNTRSKRPTLWWLIWNLKTRLFRKLRSLKAA